MKPRLDWRHQYDTTRDEAEGDAAGLACLDESLTQQHFTEDADLNTIARRFGLTEIPSAPLDPSLFRDTTNDPTLVQILDAQREARDQFAALPWKIRKRFHNSPRELWDFITDPENEEEILRLGLLSRPAGDAATTPTPTATSTTTTAPATTAPPSTGEPTT